MIDADSLLKKSTAIIEEINSLSIKAHDIDSNIKALFNQAAENNVGGNNFVYALTVFILSCIVGYHIVWRVTPALHTPLMSVTNAISGIIIIGAMIAAGSEHFQSSNFLGILAVILSAISVFGGFFVTYRMLSMFRKK